MGVQNAVDNIAAQVGSPSDTADSGDNNSPGFKSAQPTDSYMPTPIAAPTAQAGAPAQGSVLSSSATQQENQAPRLPTDVLPEEDTPPNVAGNTQSTQSTQPGAPGGQPSVAGHPLQIKSGAELIRDNIVNQVHMEQIQHRQEALDAAPKSPPVGTPLPIEKHANFLDSLGGGVGSFVKQVAHGLGAGSVLAAD